MELINKDQLMTIFQADPVFTQVAEALKETHGELASSIVKLEQDAGQQWMRLMPKYNPQAGKETASIAKNYEPVTTERLNILEEIHSVLSNQSIQADLSSLIQTLKEQASSVEPIALSAKVGITFDNK